MVIDCSGPQPQLHNAGEITCCNIALQLDVSPLDPSAAESCDIRGSWGYSEAHRLLPRKFGFCFPMRYQSTLLHQTHWNSGSKMLGNKIHSTFILWTMKVWLVQFRESAKPFFPVDFDKHWEKGFNNQNTVLCNHCSCACFSFPHVLFFVKTHFLAQVHCYHLLGESD